MATAQRFEELIAWQLSERLKEEVFRLTQRERVCRDRNFCEQIQGSARSAPANIAEGFGRYDPKPNKNFVCIAKASLEETKNHILDGFKRNHFDVVERDDLLKLTKRALIATTRSLRYLRSCKRAPEGKQYVPKESKQSAPPKSKMKVEQPGNQPGNGPAARKSGSAKQGKNQNPGNLRNQNLEP